MVTPVDNSAHHCHDVFVEIVRDERDQSLTLNFRRKGKPTDGQAFFCLCQADVAESKETTLFQRLSQSTDALKLFAVQSDAFHHTGVLECGYCTVQQSVGSSRLRNIKPNVPYLIAIAIHAQRWSKRALVGGQGGSRPGAASEVAAVDRLGDDAVPFVDKVVLRELREQRSRLRPAFHIAGRSPWRDNLIPSLHCVRYISWQFHGFLRKNILHLQRNTESVDSAQQHSNASRHTDNPLTNSLLERQLIIHGVTDPLCGVTVSFIQSMADVVRKFREKRQVAGVKDHSHKSCRSSKRDEEDESSSRECLGSPPGSQPTAGDFLEAIAVLGSRVHHSTLSASWTVDWYDVLLLACVDAPSLKRIIQVAAQFKSYDMEGQPLQARLMWMIRPEKRPFPAGSLQKLFVSEASRLGLEPEVSAAHMVYLPCPLSPARAVWTWMTHRQQVRAMYYVTPVASLADEVKSVRRVMLQPTVVQPLQKGIRRALARGRLRVWIAFVHYMRAKREYLKQREEFRQRSSQELGPLILDLVARAETQILQQYMGYWMFFRIRNKFLAPMAESVRTNHLRSRFQLWRLATLRQYNIRVPRTLTIKVRGDQDLMPMPKTWIRRLHCRSENPRVQCSHVMVSLGNHTPPIVSMICVTTNAVSTRRVRHSSHAHDDFSAGAGPQLYGFLAQVTRHRDMFDSYRMWRRFGEIAHSLRSQQMHQIRAVQQFADNFSSDAGLRRILFVGWKKWAEMQKYSRSMHASTPMHNSTNHHPLHHHHRN